MNNFIFSFLYLKRKERIFTFFPLWMQCYNYVGGDYFLFCHSEIFNLTMLCFLCTCRCKVMTCMLFCIDEICLKLQVFKDFENRIKMLPLNLFELIFHVDCDNSFFTLNNPYALNIEHWSSYWTAALNC